MSLRKKITLGFVISASVIALLAVFEYLNFIEIRKEVRSLEFADTLRNKSLQLRRHEKNFFLYGRPKAIEESAAIRRYLGEIDALLDAVLPQDRTGNLAALKQRIQEYGRRFGSIEESVGELTTGFDSISPRYRQYARVLPFMKSAFLDRPFQTAELLRDIFLLPPGHKLVQGLYRLDAETSALRKMGEEVLTISKELDSTARANVDRFIHLSQIALVVLIPLFFIVGIGTLFFISSNVVSRLRLLIEVVEKKGKGEFFPLSVMTKWGGNDEVGLLIRKFNAMEEQLALREEELARKNSELLHTKKLAAIGTLAAGVAHELNNPLNNINISAQMLVKETGDTCPGFVQEIVGDIVGQTVRVKRIVEDLLEFARGREPRKQQVDLNEIIAGAYRLVGALVTTEGVRLSVETKPGGLMAAVDPEQMERVFINLFTNAVQAMSGKGELKVVSERGGDHVMIKVSDTGRGMPSDAEEKIFEPFFTTKDRGTGLGLAIVFNIIRKHGGDISAESAEGRGTTFTITLPVAGEAHGL
ncbi:MAG: GHKL domain-containing protein [Nitrospirales bacterium]|nr:GHKL domain-containing protein [Nitrospirales bacterium]